MSDLLLLTTELVTNAVRHGGRPGSEIDVTLLRTDTAVRVEVGDPGPGFDPGASAPGHDRGWGLFLVDRLADRWGVERIGNRTVVWFELAAA
jgi:anti-sigma regulatory factor (Ser/Thr protein kinase)